MTENNEILDKLISDKTSKYIMEEDSWKEDSMASQRIVQVRYRFYTVWLLLVWLIFWSLLFLPSLDKLEAKKNELKNLDQQLEVLENREKVYNETIWFLQDVSTYNKQIVACMNKPQWATECSEIPEYIQNDSNYVAVARSYLLAYEMSDTKMDIDERRIIENIDNFLLKLDPFAWNFQTNWSLSKIYIWDKEQFNEWMYVVPVQLNITFDNKDWLMSFINNVEKHIPEDENLRVLYKIDKISYDIVNEDEPQETVVDMSLYYYE